MIILLGSTRQVKIDFVRQVIKFQQRNGYVDFTLFLRSRLRYLAKVQILLSYTSTITKRF